MAFSPSPSDLLHPHQCFTPHTFQINSLLMSSNDDDVKMIIPVELFFIFALQHVASILLTRRHRCVF